MVPCAPALPLVPDAPLVPVAPLALLAEPAEPCPGFCWPPGDWLPLEPLPVPEADPLPACATANAVHSNSVNIMRNNFFMRELLGCESLQASASVPFDARSSNPVGPACDAAGRPTGRRDGA